LTRVILHGLEQMETGDVERASTALSREDAVALARELYAAANRHDTSALAAHYAPDAVAVSPQFSTLRGRGAIAHAWEALFAMVPDCTVEVSDVLVDGHRIAILGLVRGTDRNGWFGLPPTGGPITYRLNILLTIVDGLIVRDERIYDSAGVVERLQKALVDKELRTAAEVQRALLSRTAYAGGRSEAVGDSVPCRAIGGDFFELIDLAGGRLGIALGDVAGKGAPAALLAAMLQGMLVSEAPVAGRPGAVLARLNRHLAARAVESRFATVVYGVLEPDGAFVYSNAGHNAPALMTASGIVRLTAGGSILGIFPQAEFPEATVRLGAGDTLVMFTDGVTEARNAMDEEFGEERLLASASAHAALAPRPLLDRLFADVRRYSEGVDPTDDVTMIVARFV
jgi:uncharacterized protein (TIGR02246 family)